MNAKRKIEASKLLLIAAWSVAGLLVLALIVATFMNMDTSGLTVAVSASFAELAIHTSVYSWKAKSENRVKILAGMIEQYSTEKKMEPDTLANYFESVTKGD